MRLGALAFGMIVVVASACAGRSEGAVPTGDVEADESGKKLPARDWSAHPAIVEIDQAGSVYAVSDPHGEYALFAKLLAGNHLLAAVPTDPTRARWSGGAATLVVAGDLIDKGPASLEVIDLVRALEADAPRHGGRVVVTMGNHEAEFLLDPENAKAKSDGQDAIGIDHELAAASIPPGALVKGTDPGGRGAWMASLPFGVRIKKWFFAHAGNTQKRSIHDLAKDLEHGVDKNGYGDDDLTGKDSLLEADHWFGNPDDDGCGRKEADALGVKHIVFGHDPGAFGKHGAVEASKNGVLVKIDTAMGMHDGKDVGSAYLLHIETVGTDTAEVLDDEGHAKKLF